MDRSIRARAYRGIATFLVTVGTVLMALAAGLALRETFLPSTDTWPAWTSNTILLLGALAVVFWLCGALLSRRAHRTRRDTVRTFLSGDERERVVAAVREFERRTSGEIRVHLQERIDGSAKDEAARVFDKLGMARTRDRNGVLFFVGVRDRRFAVIGDTGIYEALPGNFWSGVVTCVEGRFANGQYAMGLIEGIRMAGTALANHFPPRPDDINELPDSLSD
jgi:uncharacterized membrane protein